MKNETATTIETACDDADGMEWVNELNGFWRTDAAACVPYALMKAHPAAYAMRAHDMNHFRGRDYLLGDDLLLVDPDSPLEVGAVIAYQYGGEFYRDTIDTGFTLDKFRQRFDDGAMSYLGRVVWYSCGLDLATGEDVYPLG